MGGRSHIVTGIAALAVLVAACGGDDKPATTANATATAAASATAPGTTLPTAVLPPQPTTTAPAGSVELPPGDYGYKQADGKTDVSLKAQALTCEGPNILVLKTSDDTFYFQTLVATGYACEQVRAGIVKNLSVAGAEPKIEDRTVGVRFVKSAQPGPAGEYEANLAWDTGGSTLLIVFAGWHTKKS